MVISKTPYKVKYGKKPNIINIRLFNSIIYLKNDKLKKLEERASYYKILINFSEN